MRTASRSCCPIVQVSWPYLWLFVIICATHPDCSRGVSTIEHITMHSIFGGQLSDSLFFFEHLLDHFGLEFRTILLPRLLLHVLLYILRADQFLSEILGSV